MQHLHVGGYNLGLCKDASFLVGGRCEKDAEACNVENERLRLITVSP